MRGSGDRIAWVVCVSICIAIGGCDSGGEAASTAASKSAEGAAGPRAGWPELAAEDVCKAFVALPTPPHIVTIAASATESAIEPTADGTAMRAQIVELRAESGPVENGERRIDGVTLMRELTLKYEGSAWTIASDKGSSRSEIFYVHKTPDHDPRKLFGQDVVERYGPKGGKPCELPPPPAAAAATGVQICAAFFASEASRAHELLHVTAAPGFTAPQTGKEKEPPKLAAGQVGATLRQLRIEAKGPTLVSVTENLVLAPAGEGWTIAGTQPVFRGEVGTGDRAALRDPAMIERGKPARGTPCELPKK